MLFHPTGDKNWYRAVFLETTETEASVIYADYGNSEKLPFASILPIPTEFLELPFQIARCALTGKRGHTRQKATAQSEVNA